MRKLICVILTVALALCCAACSGGETAKNEEPLSFTYNGVEIALNVAAEPILTALGEPISYTEETSCAFEGLDKTYGYDGFYLQTYPGEDGDMVFGFWFVDDSVSTAEGISIGDTEADVLAAYGSEAQEGPLFMVARDGGKLSVLLADGVVSSIQYQIVL